MWHWLLIILIIDIVAGTIYAIKNPPKPLKSFYAVTYVLFWFLTVYFVYQTDKQSRKFYENLKLAGTGSDTPAECIPKPQSSSKCSGCNRSSCPNRL